MQKSCSRRRSSFQAFSLSALTDPAFDLWNRMQLFFLRSTEYIHRQNSAYGIAVTSLTGYTHAASLLWTQRHPIFIYPCMIYMDPGTTEGKMNKFLTSAGRNWPWCLSWLLGESVAGWKRLYSNSLHYKPYPIAELHTRSNSLTSPSNVREA